MIKRRACFLICVFLLYLSDVAGAAVRIEVDGDVIAYVIEDFACEDVAEGDLKTCACGNSERVYKTYTVASVVGKVDDKHGKLVV